MKFSSTPIQFVRDEVTKQVSMERNVSNPSDMLDNWIDTIIFTGIRRFKADVDFGFSFWDNEFIALNFNDFNNGVDFMNKVRENKRTERVRMSSSAVRICEKSIRDSLSLYLPSLRDVNVTVSLKYERDKKSQRDRKEHSKYAVKVKVTGRTVFDEFTGTRDDSYERNVTFYMDPFLNSKENYG